MLNFVCPARKARASLDFPRLVITYEGGRDTPKEQDHNVFRVVMHKASNASSWPGLKTWHEVRGAMPEVQAFLSTLDAEGLVKSKTWDYDRFDLRLDFSCPVTVGEFENIESIVLTYYPWWARTERMIAAHAEWRARVNA